MFLQENRLLPNESLPSELPNGRFSSSNRFSFVSTSLRSWSVGPDQPESRARWTYLAVKVSFLESLLVGDTIKFIPLYSLYIHTPSFLHLVSSIRVSFEISFIDIKKKNVFIKKE